jgi:ferredoxin
MAIGQQVDRQALALDSELTLNPNGTVKIDEVTLATSMKGIFAGGDAVYGPRIVIDSVANGKLAARSIMEYLDGNNARDKSYHFDMLNTTSYSMPDGFERALREKIPQIDVGRRVGFAEVELGYSEEQARREGERCLKCNINTIFDSLKCILCGGCVDVCPENCLRLVDSSRVTIQSDSSPVAEMSAGSFAILKDETLCIRCGLCAKRCPTDAITMERIVFDEYANA